MDQLKEAFVRIKQDISTLQEELFFVKKELDDLKSILQELVNTFKQNLLEQKKEMDINKEFFEEFPTQRESFSTKQEFNPTEKSTFKPLKYQNKKISIGNDGVPTDRQTNQQTNQQTAFNESDRRNLEQEEFNEEKGDILKKDSFREAANMLESLDNLKKELRLKFKRLTDQEILIFSSLYQLEEEKGYADYRSLSTKLNLTESSIRDYVGKLIKKGIPVDKIKINNKSVHLGISPHLKKIATLSTILLLRDL